MKTDDNIVQLLLSRPDWRDPSAYPPVPSPTESLQYFGVEFARRGSAFEARLRDWLAQVSAEEKAEIRREPDGKWHFPWEFAERVLFFSSVDLGPRCPQWTFRYEGVEVQAEPIAPDRMTLVFDLNETIEDQLVRARGRLRTWQAGARKAKRIPSRSRIAPTRDQLPGYLRVLDAKRAGALHREIAEQLSNEDCSAGDPTWSEQNVTDALRAARKLAEGDYVELLRIADPNPKLQARENRG